MYCLLSNNKFSFQISYFYYLRHIVSKKLYSFFYFFLSCPGPGIDIGEDDCEACSIEGTPPKLSTPTTIFCPFVSPDSISVYPLPDIPIVTGIGFNVFPFRI